jgi:hypothetical protein
VTRKKIIKYVFMAMLLLAPSAATVMSYHGFCFSQGRFLNDTEMIEPTVRALAEDKDMNIDSSPDAIKDFLQRNPDCCAVDRYPDWRGWLDVVTGWNTSEVEVNFERNPKRLSRENYEKYYKRYVSVSACGNVLKRGPGTSTPTLETARRGL